jgi:hypothetical protein
MSNQRISDLNPHLTLENTDLFVVVNDSETKNVTFENIKDAVAFTPTDYSYSIAFVEVEECPELIAKYNTITAVTLSSQIASYELSINGGAFAVPSLPLSLTAGNELVWKIVYESGEDKGNINITANI